MTIIDDLPHEGEIYEAMDWNDKPYRFVILEVTETHVWWKQLPDVNSEPHPMTIKLWNVCKVDYRLVGMVTP